MSELIKHYNKFRTFVPAVKGVTLMNQYIDYIRNAIIETVTATKDETTLQMIYSILMQSHETNSEEVQSAS